MDASLYCPALVYPSLCHQQLPSSIFFFFHFTVLSRSYQMSLSSQEIPLEKSQGPYKQSQAWNTSSASITLSLWDIGLSKAVCSIMTARGVQITPEMDQKDLNGRKYFPDTRHDYSQIHSSTLQHPNGNAADATPQKFHILSKYAHRFCSRTFLLHLINIILT